MHTNIINNEGKIVMTIDSDETVESALVKSTDIPQGDINVIEGLANGLMPDGVTGETGACYFADLFPFDEHFEITYISFNGADKPIISGVCGKTEQDVHNHIYANMLDDLKWSGNVLTPDNYMDFSKRIHEKIVEMHKHDVTSDGFVIKDYDTKHNNLAVAIVLK